MKNEAKIPAWNSYILKASKQNMEDTMEDHINRRAQYQKSSVHWKYFRLFVG